MRSKSSNLISNDSVFQKIQGILVAEIKENVVSVLNPENTKEIFEIEKFAVQIWNVLDGDTSVDQLIDFTLSNSPLEKNEAIDHVINFVNDLYSFDLIALKGKKRSTTREKATRKKKLVLPLEKTFEFGGVKSNPVKSLSGQLLFDPVLKVSASGGSGGAGPCSPCY